MIGKKSFNLFVNDAALRSKLCYFCKKNFDFYIFFMDAKIEFFRIWAAAVVQCFDEKRLREEQNC